MGRIQGGFNNPGAHPGDSAAQGEDPGDSAAQGEDPVDSAAQGEGQLSCRKNEGC